MPTGDNQFQDRAIGTVRSQAAHWLNTVEGWTPILEKSEHKIAELTFTGKYSIACETDLWKEPGFNGKNCDDEREAKNYIDAYLQAWSKLPNDEQKADIFKAIKSGHKDLSPHKKRISSESAKWQETCSTCLGEKGRTCHGCGGQKRVVHRSCNGSGKIPCAGCGGTGGKTYVDNHNNRYRQQCMACSGNRIQQCMGCWGSGQVGCGTCGATGWLECGPCHATGQFTHTLEGTVNLVMQTGVARKDHENEDERFSNLVDDVWSAGMRGQIPGFNSNAQVIWNDDLEIEQAQEGHYSGFFTGRLPFYFVDMKPDQRFEGPATTTIFCGMDVKPISLGYIFDTTINQLVDADRADIRDGKEDIKAWTASKVCEEIHDHAAEHTADRAEPEVLSLKGISENAVKIIKEGYDKLEEKFTQPGKTMSPLALLARTLKLSVIGYCILVGIGMITLNHSMNTGALYAINWDVVGLGEWLRTYVDRPLDDVMKDIKRTPVILTMFLCPFALAIFWRFFLSGPKKWSGERWMLIGFLCVVISWGITGQIYQLREHFYYVFPADHSFDLLSMLISEMIGVLVMIPDLIAVCALMAYARIRRDQDIEVRNTLNELEATTLKAKLGFVN